MPKYLPEPFRIKMVEPIQLIPPENARKPWKLPGITCLGCDQKMFLLIL